MLSLALGEEGDKFYIILSGSVQVLIPEVTSLPTVFNILDSSGKKGDQGDFRFVIEITSLPLSKLR